MMREKQGCWVCKVWRTWTQNMFFHLKIEIPKHSSSETRGQECVSRICFFVGLLMWLWFCVERLTSLSSSLGICITSEIILSVDFFSCDSKSANTRKKEPRGAKTFQCSSHFWRRFFWLEGQGSQWHENPLLTSRCLGMDGWEEVKKLFSLGEKRSLHNGKPRNPRNLQMFLLKALGYGFQACQWILKFYRLMMVAFAVWRVKRGPKMVKGCSPETGNWEKITSFNQRSPVSTKDLPRATFRWLQVQEYAVLHCNFPTKKHQCCGRVIKEVCQGVSRVRVDGLVKDDESSL